MPQSASNHDQEQVKRLRIRKYPNRRYYDSTRSRHLTLEEIHQSIRDGYEVEVTDSKTGQDITAKVLAQMIIELDAPKLGVFPVPLLHRLLRANEQLLNDFTQKYFNQALNAFLDSQKTFEQSMRSAMGLKSTTPTVADWTRLMWGPFNPATWAGPSPQTGTGHSRTSGSGAGPTAAATAANDVTSVVADLRSQVDDLKRQLAGAKRKRGTRAKTKRASRR